MTTYQTRKKSESSTVEVIPEDEFAYHSRRLQIRVFGAMVNAFADEVRAGHISRAKLAKKINKSPEQITRWLSQPSNMKLDTISRIYCGLGAEMKDPSAAFFRDAVRPNYAHPLIDELAATNSSDTHALPVEQEIKDVPASPTRASRPPAVVQEPVYL